MERPTKEIMFGSHKAIVYTYATIQETREMQGVYFSKGGINMVGDTPQISNFDPNAQFDVENAMIEKLVVSIDDDKEKILERCLQLPTPEYQLLLEQLNELTFAKKN